MYHNHFDTLDVSKSFIANGMQTQLAETVAKAISSSRDADFSHLATKTDLMEVKSELVAVKSELLVKIAESKSEMLKWFIGVAIASVGTVTGLVALLLKYFIQ